MRTIMPSLIAAVRLSAAVLSAVALTSSAADGRDPVNTGHEPYKPGRQINDGDSVKTSQQAYKPGRQADDTALPLKSARTPYKPSREADDGSDAGSGSKK